MLPVVHIDASPASALTLTARYDDSLTLSSASAASHVPLPAERTTLPYSLEHAWCVLCGPRRQKPSAVHILSRHYHYYLF